MRSLSLWYSTSTNNCTRQSSNAITYLDIKLKEEIWTERIQDVGFKESKLLKKRYWLAEILLVGPVDIELFYYHLSAIAFDYVKDLVKMAKIGTAWKNLPKNLINIKAKIVQIYLQTRTMCDNVYRLDQECLIKTLHGQ